MSSPSALALSGTRPSSKRACVALVFGLGGLISGLTVAFAMFSLRSGVAAADGKPGFLIAPALALFLGLFVGDFTGVLFLLVMIAAFAICRSVGWLDFNPVRNRFLVAAILVILGPWWGILTFLSAKDLIGPGFGYAGLVVVCQVVGIFVVVFLLSLALYVLTSVWDYGAWGAMIIVATSLVAATAALYPEFFERPPGGAANDYIGEHVFLLFHIAGQTLFGACAGYWLARSQKSAAVSS
jgi:hypothetical protein